MFFFFNDTATTEIYTLSLHDALPIYRQRLPVAGGTRVDPVRRGHRAAPRLADPADRRAVVHRRGKRRSEEHTSELQSRQYLVCRLLLEKTNTTLSHSTTTLPPCPSST